MRNVPSYLYLIDYHIIIVNRLSIIIVQFHRVKLKSRKFKINNKKHQLAG